MTLSDPVILAIAGGIGAGFLLLIRWVFAVYTDLKEDRDYWRDRFMEVVDQSEVATELAERGKPERLSPDAANAAQRIVRRSRRA